MRKLYFFPALLSVLAGIGGFFLRKQQLNTIFDSVSGLAQTNAPVTIYLSVLSTVFSLLALIFAFSIVKNSKRSSSYYSAFHIKSFGLLTLHVVSGIILSAFSVVWLLKNGTDFYAITFTSSAFFILSFLSGISVILSAISAYRKKHIKGSGVMSVVPCLFFCVWLLEIYKQNSTNPVLLDFYIPCFACMASCLSFFYNAGYAFSHPKPKLTIIFNMLGIFFCITALADSFTMSEVVMLCAFILIQILSVSTFIKNFHKNKK